MKDTIVKILTDERNEARRNLVEVTGKFTKACARIRQLEDAAAHWEHKYANARQYNRNLEERNQKLEAALRDTLSGNYPTPARYDEIRALVATVETKGEQG